MNRTVVFCVSRISWLQTCSRYSILCRCLAQLVIFPSAGLMPRQPFPVLCFVFFLPNRSSLACLPFALASRDALVVPDDKSRYSYDLWWFWLRPIHIGRLWEFQPSQSHRLPKGKVQVREGKRNTSSSGDFLLSEQAF